MLLQGGHTCFSIDNPVGQPFGFTWIARDLARHGYVTMRVERPGCGDSEGGPSGTSTSIPRLDGYKQALRALKQLDFVDADNVFLFGHSMGGIMAPLMAVEVPVRGIAVYGTGSGTWFEGILGQRRRLASLDGTRPAEVDREILGQARFWYPLLVERKTPREILRARPRAEAAGRRSGNSGSRTTSMWASRHYTFHHQARRQEPGRGLDQGCRDASSGPGKVPRPRLADRPPRCSRSGARRTGSSIGRGNAWIAEIVNRAKPGNGTFVALDAIDHFFFRAATPEESYRYFKPAKGLPAREFNPDILEVLRRWLDEASGRVEKPPEDSPASRDGDRFSGMDTYIRAAMGKWEVPGLAIAVVKDGEVVLARGYGVCELGKDRRVTADTAFPLASCSKSFLAAAVGLLVEEGKLRWDDPVARHLPDFELSDRYLTEHVTLRDLLCHRTGLRRCDLLGDRFGPGGDPASPQVHPACRRLPHEVDLQQRTCTPSSARW